MELEIRKAATKKFEQHSSSKTHLNQVEFIKAILNSDDEDDLKRNLNIQNYENSLFQCADLKKQGLIDLEDFIEFETLMSRPDAEFLLAFRLIDEKKLGAITIAQLKSWVPKNAIDFSGNPLRLFAGGKSNGDDEKILNYNDFTEFMKSFKTDRLIQEFKKHDVSNNGMISPQDLQDIIVKIAGHRLSYPLLESLATSISSFAFPTNPSLPTTKNIPFSVALAVFNISQNVDLISSLISQSGTDWKIISKEQFAIASASNGSIFSPLEINLIFHLVKPNKLPDSSLSAAPAKEDFNKLIYPSWGKLNEHAVEITIASSHGVLESIYNFALGSVAGAIGASAVYPIDLVKTRMQNQRSQLVGQVMYKNSLDCFRKVIKNEGFKGLYSGLFPQLVGVAPEKAIKLTMNDLVRNKFKDPVTGAIDIKYEVLAGCSAGASQVVFTNPLEIVKIRLQVAGELATKSGIPRESAVKVARSLGLFGVYKGVAACLLRDVPFSGIYFTAYAHLKSDYFNEGVGGKKLAGHELLISGAVAGIPAAFLVTPADVIKTRLQVAARKGDTHYFGIRDAFVKIMKEEGPRAFFKGGVARVFRSSPQFGVTLWAYENLKNLIPIHFEGNTPVWKPIKKNKFGVGAGPGYNIDLVNELTRRNALRTIYDLK